jgi:hypothetical protein
VTWRWTQGDLDVTATQSHARGPTPPFPCRTPAVQSAGTAAVVSPNCWYAVGPTLWNDLQMAARKA